MKSTAALIGIDLGKHTFHAHAQDKQGHFVFRQLFTRKKLIEFLANSPTATIAMEACAGAHWLARKLGELGHTVKLIAPQYVKPFVKGNKHDFADAEAICEAAARPSMRFVTVKTEQQQTLAMLHRLRESRVGERTLTMNQIQAFLLEFGISFPVGHAKMRQLLAHLVEVKLPPALHSLLEKQHAYYLSLCEQIRALEKDIATLLAQDENAQRLLAVPDVGPITASLIAAEAGDAKQHRKGRDFAASLGLVPRQYSTGGKVTL